MKTIDTLSARTRHVFWAGGTAVILACLTVLALPVLDEQWAVRPWFQAMYLCGVFLLEGLVALFLFLHVLARVPSRPLAWLSAGYMFNAFMAVAQLLAFPGLLNPPLAPDSDDATAWLWVAWHGGFPSFVLLALWVKSRPGMRAQGYRLPGWQDFLQLATGGLAALLLAFLIVRYSRALPDLVEDGNYSALSESFIAAALLSLNVAALAGVVYVTRLRKSLYLWLAVAQFAFTLDVVLSLLGSARYSAGWYIGRGLSLASAAALMVALLIEHFKLHRDAEIRAAFHEQEARHDPLTGLFNRRHLAEELAEELRRAQRYRYPVALLLLDIDYFKRINDEHGHQMGDQCLVALAQTLMERVHRSGDCTARFGGEEFVVVLPETGLEGALEVAEEIRQRAEGLCPRGRAPYPVTLSIGVAVADPGAPCSAAQLMAAADVCLYRAKRQGRNRVVAAPHSCGSEEAAAT